MKKLVTLLLLAALMVGPLLHAAVRGKGIMYVGGTLASIPEKTKGKLNLEETAFVFADKNGVAKLSIPYASVESLEYGQKAGRRVGVALAVNPLFLFSKKRKHFLTIGFVDEQKRKQGAVFELAKGIVKETLTTLEEKSGKQVEYESDEAKKHAEKQ
jgi:hypothetical protein